MRAPSEADLMPKREAAPRPPVRAVTVLMPVWGYRFVSQFLEFCLPTLLAPGNLPAVAALLPIRFVLLTREADELLIRSNPAGERLDAICTRRDPADRRPHHRRQSHARPSRSPTRGPCAQTGEAMLDTCFIFLVSDYLVADGSLATVLARIQAGASGVFAGNFQIIAEDAIPLLRRRIDAASPTIDCRRGS